MKNKGNEINLVVKSEDIDLLEVSKEFIEKIEIEFKKYLVKYKKVEQDDRKYAEKENYYFIPEELTKKSPLTIINAPWGTGKTYFIENLLKLLINKKIESKVFKRMLIIDAWKFSNSKDIPIEFIKELSRSLMNLSGKKYNEKQQRGMFRKFLSKLIPTSIVFGYESFVFEASWKKELNKEEIEEIDSDWNLISDNKEPTIIFIDNLERLGSLSWDLLKAVIKLQEFSNYLVVLPLNINKIKNNDKVDNSEYPIEKYIDIALFNFEQDYHGYFSKKLKNNNDIKLINEIFSEEIEGEKLSIREVDQSFRKTDIFSLSDTYKLLKNIYNKIWPAKDAILNLLKNDFSIFISLEREKKELIYKVYDNISKKNEEGKYLNFVDNVSQSDNNIISWSDGNKYYYNISGKYEKDLSYFNKLIIEKQEDLKSKIDRNNLEKEQNLLEITSIDSGISKQEKDIEKFSKKIADEYTKSLEDRKSEVITINEKNKELAEEFIRKGIEEKNKLENKNINLSNENTYYDKNVSLLFSDINNLIKEYKEIKEKQLSILGSKKLNYIKDYILSFEEHYKIFEDEMVMEEIEKDIFKIIE